jgi:uncharacterized protein (DUF58 family)
MTVNYQKAKKLRNRFNNWLETRWVAPAYAGWLLIAFSLFFFGSATNTMAGWLYLISGFSFAILGMAAVLPGRSLRHLKVYRRPIPPVSVGDSITVVLEIENPTKTPNTLLEVVDAVSWGLGKNVREPIELIPPFKTHRWTYYLPAKRRGIYYWEGVQLRTAAPLGLFWCNRSREAKATAVVYPTVLPLAACPLVDEVGQEYSPRLSERNYYHAATEGLTKTLRPYRFGDPSRFIHWRSSARYGDLRVRELEVATGGQEIIIALDSGRSWPREDDFEAAVTAAASLYFYANRSQLNVQLWTAGSGLVSGNWVVLQALAAVNSGEGVSESPLPKLPCVWLTGDRSSLNSLAGGSRWVLWPEDSASGEKSVVVDANCPGIEIENDVASATLRERPLQLQLQSSPKAR